MKIEILKAVPGTSYVRGDVITVELEKGKKWVEAGFASEVKASKPKSKAKTKK